MEKGIKDMDRSEVIAELQKFFKVQELVCTHVFARDGQKSWRYLSTDILRVLLCLRTEILCVPFVVNDATHKQRGYRCNLCDLVKSNTAAGKLYATAHTGQALDIIPKDMTAEDARKRIVAQQDKLPCCVRLERDVTWLHVDTYDDGTQDKITLFKG